MSVVDEIRQRVDQRLQELAPAVQEYNELLAVKQGLAAGGDVGAATEHGTHSGGGRSARTTSRRPRRATTRRGGGRAEETIRIVSGRPGVTVKEIAAEMGINENYLYRLLPRMESEGKLRREGRGWAVAAG